MEKKKRKTRRDKGGFHPSMIGNKNACGWGRPLRFETVEDMEKGIEEYINDCINNNKKMTYTGLATALGTWKDVLNDYITGKHDKDGKCFSYPLKKVKNIIEAQVEDLLLEKGHSGSIFWLKNFGWKDKFEHDVELKGCAYTLPSKQAVEAHAVETE